MTRIRPISLVALAALLAACGSGVAAPTGSAAATSSGSAPGGSSSASRPAATLAASPAPTPAQTLELGPALTLTLDSSGPMVRSTDGPAGHPYALPAAAARDAAGGYVLFIVWFGRDPGDQIVTVARSDDGRTWQPGKAPIFTDLGMQLANPGPIPSSALQLDDGTWLLYGWAAHATDSRTFTSWRASAPKPEGPWTLDAETVLSVGSATSWDSQAASVGVVHRTADGYALWYEGQQPGSSIRGDVGYATSADGLAWQKWNDPATTDAPFVDSDPAIRRGLCGPGSSQAIFQPEIRSAAGGGLLAVFGAFGPGRETMDLFGATSSDGINWKCGSAIPILRPTDIPGSEGIHTITSMELADGTVELIIESLGDGRSELWRATVEVAQ
ncbi:MAG: hypothetical protein ABI620_06150 [Chloroflexota bacterium]